MTSYILPLYGIAFLVLRCCSVGFFAHAFRQSRSWKDIACRSFINRLTSVITSSQQSICQHRIGQGYDIHRLVEDANDGKPLTLGGVRIDGSGVYVVGHSDGDTVLHAIADAILGAVGLGDIGERYPDSDPANRDLDSRVILQTALEEARKLGYVPANIDASIILQRPKLGRELKRRISSSVSELVSNDVTVNIKAKTNEGLDSIGSGQAIACQAVVLMRRIS
ncbi:2-C-methyl-D-erythritol 2 [Babesia gibsoni]|uniref:2-C-methyl-D-erythritol 2,4-cyclodiphosphate synthase n=1 Tax=Babesia gibsoni TaxID=33632 RepID=A0AAD8LHG5_BABGI|nr:2-C-methyl-D-erythritol 2 [Babesia gibsoni]